MNPLSLAIVYHSAHGHTDHIARHVAAGASSVAGLNMATCFHGG